MMRVALVDPIGVLVAWGSAILLLLFFVRLGRARARGPLLRTWTAAWAVLALSLAGMAVRAIAAIAGSEANPVSWLDDLHVPLRLLFIGWVGVGAVEAVGRSISASWRTVIVAAAIVLGGAALVADQAALTGTLLVAATVAVFFGAPITITSIDRRRRGRRGPLLAAMVVFGVTSGAGLFAGYFADAHGDAGGLVGALGHAANYLDGVALLVLGAAVVTLIVEDTARGVRHLGDQQVRDRAELEAQLAGVIASGDSALVSARLSEPRIRDEPIERFTASAGHDADWPGSAGMSAPLRAPVLEPRMATLPQPRPDSGSVEILLIASEAATRSNLARIFQRGGWSIREQATAEEGLTRLLTVGVHEMPALVLCEFNMPGMSGREVYWHLQRERPELLGRVVFLVRQDRTGADTAFLQDTGCPVIREPYAISEIAAAVERALLAMH